MRYRPVCGTLALAALVALTTSMPRECRAVAVSPRLVEAARGTPNGAAVLQSASRYEAARLAGVDRVYKQFALSLAGAPQGVTAHRNVLVVLCDFDADLYGPAWHAAPASTAAYYDSLFFRDDPDDGLTSMGEYYRDNSQGRLVISGRVTSAWLTMPHSYAYYANGQSGLDFGGYPRSAQKLAEDAMAAAYSAAGNDLRFFDNDGPDGIPSSGDDDGYIDAVCVIHPGQGAEVLYGPASGQALWSHEAGIATYSDCPVGSSGPGCLPGLILGSVRGFLYTLGPEFNDYPGDYSCGTYFHEFGHTLGLVDLYDPLAAGLGFYSLMALGNYLPFDPSCDARFDPACPALGSHPTNLDAWSRQFIGLESPAVPAEPGSHVVAPANVGGGSLKAWTNGQPGPEYFLMESRAQVGEDAYLPGAGLLIYHVDDTQLDNLDSGAAHHRVAVVQADGRDDLGSSMGGFGDAGDFFPGVANNQTWNESTVPSSRDYSGHDTQVRMSGITRSPAGDVSFQLSVSTASALRIAAYRVRDGGNGFADANERDSLFVSVRNVGIPSGPILYTLTTSDPYVNMVTGASSSSAVMTGGVVELSAPFVVDVETPPIIPHVVVFDLSWNDGSTSGSCSFSVAIGMRAGLSEGFESGEPGWTHQALAPSVADGWHVSSSRAHGGAMSMKLGSRNALGDGSNVAQTYAAMEDAALVSPMFQLAPGSRLTFHSWIDAETNGGTGAWDGGRVELALNGGAWVPVDVEGGYGYVIEPLSRAALRGEEAFSGSPERWRRVVADLGGYEGAAQVRFRFSSDNYDAPVDPYGNPMRYYEGWYIDDVVVSPERFASIDLDPDVINLGSHGLWVTAYIEPSDFDPSGIALSTVRLAGSIPAESKFAVVGDHDRDGLADLGVKFSRQALDPLLTPGVHELEVSGSLVTGVAFSGTNQVRVIAPPGATLNASVAPNPLNPGGALTFHTTIGGSVDVRVFDLHGRLVRTLLASVHLPAGTHELRIDGRADGDEALASGLYFYRIETAEGVLTGRIAVLK